MRWVVLLVCACSATPRSETPVDPVQRVVPDAAVAAIPDADPDPDHDRIVGDCDLCPNDPETYNAIVDEDGCPDSSGTSHAVISDPTNRLSAPIRIDFTGRVPPPTEITFEDDVELVDVIGRSSVGIKPQLAKDRAALIARRLRKTTKVPIVEHVTGATQLYLDDDIRDPRGDVIVQVMRGGGVEIWKWEDDHLVRATPHARLPVPKLPPGC